MYAIGKIMICFCSLKMQSKCLSMKKIYKEILYYSFLYVFFSDGKLDDERRINLKGDPKDFEENDGRC